MAPKSKDDVTDASLQLLLDQLAVGSPFLLPIPDSVTELQKEVFKLNCITSQTTNMTAKH